MFCLLYCVLRGELLRCSRSCTAAYCTELRKSWRVTVLKGRFQVVDQNRGQARGWRITCSLYPPANGRQRWGTAPAWPGTTNLPKQQRPWEHQGRTTQRSSGSPPRLRPASCPAQQPWKPGHVPSESSALLRQANLPAPPFSWSAGPQHLCESAVSARPLCQLALKPPTLPSCLGGD